MKAASMMKQSLGEIEHISVFLVSEDFKSYEQV
jgi:hypothetical protein